MRALALGAVLIGAKVLALSGRGLPWSVWTIPAYVWHDVAVALVFWVVDRLARGSRAMWVLYGAIVVYAAINVPITRTLSSPLTMPMLRAAGLPLLDSITRYLTAANVARMLGVVLAGGVVPWVLVRTGARARRRITIAALLIVAIGPLAVARTETLGLHRNAITALTATAWPRIDEVAAAEHQDWRASLSSAAPSDDLTRLRGVAASRNVVLIALESTAAQYLAPFGASDDPMPTVTALARDSLVFESAYAVYPESIKGFFATMCSRDPAVDVAPEVLATAPCASLAHALKDVGYRTALFHSGRFAYLGMQPIVNAVGFDLAEDAGAIGGHVESSFGVDEPATVARMLSWIDRLEPGEPFFATYLPIAGHHPYATTKPGPFAEPGERGAYKNAIHEADEAIAALLGGLRARGHADDTLVVLYGDHGEAFGQHRGNFGHTLFVYDENVRVPIVIHIGGRPDPFVPISRPASLLDLTPTILDLLGLPADARHEGVSLLDPRPRLALFFTDYALGWLGLRDGCWKYLYEIDSSRSHLFDVCRDPGETVDHGAAEKARVAIYRDRLVRWSAARRSEFSR